MSTQAQRIANRRNAQKSTGPKTAEGKARSSRNATTHGIFCRDICLEGENETDFTQFREGFLKSLAPQDMMQQALVDEIVTAHWRLARIRRAESLLHEAKADELREASEDDGEIDSAVTLVALCADPDDTHFDRLSKYEQRLQYTIHRCLRALRQLRKDRAKEDRIESETSNAKNEAKIASTRDATDTFDVPHRHVASLPSIGHCEAGEADASTRVYAREPAVIPRRAQRNFVDNPGANLAFYPKTGGSRFHPREAP